MLDFSLEKMLGGMIAGLDEAGRGPWAGPVVAAAVIFDRRRLPRALRRGIDDSKRLSPAKRLAMFGPIMENASVGVGQASVREIERINILQATLTAMTRAVQNLQKIGVTPEKAIVDGRHPPLLPCPVKCVIRADTTSLSVAAASIIAKVTRDRLMVDLARSFPGYGWETNVGYGTPRHQAALQELGVTVHHRRTFAPVLKILQLEQPPGNRVAEHVVPQPPPGGRERLPTGSAGTCAR